jgi:hypothetical protein
LLSLASQIGDVFVAVLKQIFWLAAPVYSFLLRRSLIVCNLSGRPGRQQAPRSFSASPGLFCFVFVFPIWSSKLQKQK